ncbi:MAG: hypothetical protein NTV89_00775 [Proteobacteria bacterium]|nr:hypothetical protein [Pseudomonadota bacterium]
MLEQFKAKFRFTFTGILGQFNIFLFLAFLFILGMFCIVKSMPESSVKFCGYGILTLLTIAVFGCALRVYLRKPSRSDSSATPERHAVIQGAQLTLTNPPDHCFQPQNAIQLLRLFLVGYDENLCADGEVEGNAKDGKVRIYTDEEKNKFQEQHKSDLASKRKMISSKLESMEKENHPPDATDDDIAAEQ